MTRTAFVPAVFLLTAAFGFSDAPADKRPLTHADYDGWRSIQNPQLSRGGRFLAYALTPQDGDGELVARNLASGQEWRQPLGARRQAPAGDAETAAPAPTPGPAGGRGGAPAARLQITADGRFVVFLFQPTRAEAAAARAANKRPDEIPRGGVGILELATGKASRIEGVRGFQLPEDSGAFLAYQREPRPGSGPAGPPAGAPAGGRPAGAGGTGGRRPGGAGAPASTPARAREYGSEVVIRALFDGKERTLADVLDYSFSKDGHALAFTVASRQEATNGVFVVTPGDNSPPISLLAGKGHYSRLTWDEKQTRLAFLSDRDDAGSGQPHYKVYLWDRSAPQIMGSGWPVGGFVPPTSGSVGGGPFGWVLPALQAAQASRATELASAKSAGVRKGWVISDNGALAFTADGSRLFLGTAPERAPERPTPPAPTPAPAAGEETPADDRVQLDLWHWHDDFIQPMQKVRASAEQRKTYLAVIDVATKCVRQLADETMPVLAPVESGRFAVGGDDRAYRHLVGYGPTLHDYYAVDITDGSRKPLVKKHEGGVTLSPGNRFALYFENPDWFCVDLGSGAVRNLTTGLGVRFAQEDDDTPDPPTPYGTAGWLADDRGVLVYDRFDIWLLDSAGGSAKNLTTHGRRDQTHFRYVRLDPKEKAIDPHKPILLRAENEETRDSGYWRLGVESAAPPEKLLTGPRNYAPPTKARDADVYLFTASTFNEFPDLIVGGPDLRDGRKVSDANPQKKSLRWGTAELVRFKNADGVPLSGTLYKPEGFDPTKKYPMIVYIYEKLSQNLHRFVDPQPGTSINVSYYVSNGYLVFEPDIVYTEGYPGQSALKCVLPGIQAVVDRGGVDEKAIGIQGHSWGGYQIAYMVTQTQRFKAAAAGAPVSDMVSAYDGIRWGTGLPRQFQYERTQSRIGGTIWQFPQRYIENSPIFMADRVRTPLVILHNDNDDAVPWYQGIEYYLALRRLDREVYLFNYNGEPHGLRKRANQKDWTVRLQQFFDHELKGAPAAAWQERGVPFLERDKEKEKPKSPVP